MLFHYIHHHKKYHAIFRYYYDESEDDIDDYSRKPVFYQWYMRICRIYIVDFLSAQNHNKLQKVLSIMIKPLIRFQSYFQSCSSSSTLLAELSFSKCGRGGLSWTGSPIPTLSFVTSALSFPSPQRLLLLHHSDDHWFRRLDPGSEDGGRGEEDRPLLPLPPLWHRHDCHELQPGPGGGILHGHNHQL